MQATGPIKTDARDVRGFDRIRLTGMGELTMTQGEEEGITIEAEEIILPLIETVVRDGELTIGYRREMRDMRPTQPIRFDLRLRQLSALTVSGSGSARSARIRSERLEVVISGSGAVRLDEFVAQGLRSTISGSGGFRVAGEVPGHRIEISGSGSLRAEGLRSREAEVTVSGSGGAHLNVAERLNVVISGSGSVEYQGNPHVSQVTSGSGRVRAMAP